MSKLEGHINKDKVMVKLGRKWIALWGKRIVNEMIKITCSTNSFSQKRKHAYARVMSKWIQ